MTWTLTQLCGLNPRAGRRLAALALIASLAGGAAAPISAPLQLSTLRPVGTVDERFLSYNVEMVEITGGKFWRPYGSPGNDTKEYRPPLDLANPRLRQLAAALAPAYVRYSGTWANATWFADSDAADQAPAGFDTVLTRAQWRGAVEFAKASDARIVTSFATSPGTRDANGVWQTQTAERWLAYTHQIGGTIAATEFANEPNMIWLTQPPRGYGAADYRRDYVRFAQWLKQASPSTRLLAPGIAELGEPIRTMSRRNKATPVLESEELMGVDAQRPDAFSFHFYGSASNRCGGAITGHSVAKVRQPAWLDAIDVAIKRVTATRDALAPGAPLWITESGESACGGNPWASQFADSFRFVDTLGRSARAGVRVFMHNTLAASDYGLLDEGTYLPRPNYWAALLWKRTMGQTVLAVPSTPAAGLRVYAHCLPGGQGGVGLAMLNLGDAAQQMPLGSGARVWTVQADSLESKKVTINGIAPALQPGGTFTGLGSARVAKVVALPARSIVFAAMPGARNRACR